MQNNPDPYNWLTDKDWDPLEALSDGDLEVQEKAYRLLSKWLSQQIPPAVRFFKRRIKKEPEQFERIKWTTGAALSGAFLASLVVNKPRVVFTGAVVGGLLGFSRSKSGMDLLTLLGISSPRSKKTICSVLLEEIPVLKRTATEKWPEVLAQVVSDKVKQIFRAGYRIECSMDLREFFEMNPSIDFFQIPQTAMRFQLHYNCAYLSLLAYSNKDFSQLDPSFRLLHFSRKHSNPPMKHYWGIFSQDSESNIFLIFRGTKSPYDFLVDACVHPMRISASHHQVHGGIFSSLSEILPDVLQALAAVIQNRSKKFNLIISGHSLGGAYAQLLLFHLLTQVPQAFSYVQSVRVVVFGCPTVITAKEEDDIIRTMDQLTDSFVNQFDLIPRLLGPSATVALNLLERHKVSIGAISDVISNYRPIGTTSVIAGQADGSTELRVLPNLKVVVAFLKTFPKAPALYLHQALSDHWMENYFSKLSWVAKRRNFKSFPTPVIERKEIKVAGIQIASGAAI